MENRYDVAIIGTGPAGMFAALELVDRKPGVKIVMFEKGPIRPMGDKSNVTSGWGGAGAFSDGKLDLSSVVGGTVHEVVGQAAFDDLMPYIDRRYLYFGGNHDRMIDARRDPERWSRVEALKAKALGAGLDLRPFPIRHLGTDTAHMIVMNVMRYLTARGVDIRTNCPVGRIVPEAVGGFSLICDAEGRTEFVRADCVLAAPGRSGAEWMADQAKELGLKMHNNGIDLGVRVEVLNETLRNIAELLYESKIVYQSRTFSDKVRTFCMCPSGFVAKENYRGLKTVNGHSFAAKKSPNTNFAILVTHTFADRLDKPLRYGKNISETANDLADNEVLVQRLGDFRHGRRSKEDKMREWFVQPTLRPPDAMPGDLSLVMPYRQFTGILEMLEAMETIAPGIASDHTLMYGAEVKFYSLKIETGPGFETKVPGLYVAGDGSGYTRGLLQSSMQGAIVARHIIERLAFVREKPVLTAEQRVWEASLEDRLEKLTKGGG